MNKIIFAPIVVLLMVAPGIAFAHHHDSFQFGYNLGRNSYTPSLPTPSFDDCTQNNSHDYCSGYIQGWMDQANGLAG